MADSAPVTYEPISALRPSRRRRRRGPLRSAAFALRRRIWLVAGTVALSFLAAALWSFFTPPRYAATTRLQVAVAGPAGAPLSAADAEALIDTEVAMLRAPALAGRVVDALGLTQTPGFAAPRGGGLLERGGPNPAGEADWSGRAAREAAVAAVLARTSVRRAGAGLVLEVRAETADPDLSAALANALADQHLAMQLDARFQRLQGANELLASRLSALRADLQEKEAALQAFRAENEVLTAEGTALTQSAVARLAEQLGLARADAAAKAARLRSAEVAGESPDLAALRQEEAQLNRQRAELAAQYGPRHPRMIELDGARAALQQRIASASSQSLTALRTEAQIAEQRAAGLEGAIARQRAALVGASQSGAEQAELERAAATARQMHDVMLARMNASVGAEGAEAGAAWIAARAVAPLRPTAPNALANLAWGLGLGALLGLLAAALAALLDRSLRTGEDVERKLGLKSLGALPLLTAKLRTLEGEEVAVHDYVLRRPLSQYGEGLRGVRSSLLFAEVGGRSRVVAVTSALPGEGKTVTAIGLARMCALSGMRAVLVDCDLRRASASAALGLAPQRGLVQALQADAAPEEAPDDAGIEAAIVPDPGSSLDVLPLAGVDLTPRDLFAGAGMSRILAALRARYDVVILDTAPVLPIADTRLLGALCDGVMLVVRWGRTPVEAVREALALLEDHRAPVFGAVLAGVDGGPLARFVYDVADEHDALFRKYYVQ